MEARLRHLRSIAADPYQKHKLTVTEQAFLKEAEAIQNIWDKYDTDGSQELDKPETKRFIIEILKRFNPDKGHSGSLISDREFNRLFERFDADASGTISKNEMLRFYAAIKSEY